MGDTKRLFCNISSNYEGSNEPLENDKGIWKIGKSSFNETVQNSGVQWRSKGDETFPKHESSSARRIVRRNTLSGGLLMRDVESNKLVHSEAQKQPQISKTGAATYVKCQSLSIGITSMPKFGGRMSGNTNTGSANRKMEWPLKRIGSVTSRGVLSKVNLPRNKEMSFNYLYLKRN